MNDFLSELAKPFAILILGVFLGYLRARRRKTPIANFTEFISYLRGQFKPAFYAFLAMFLIFLGFGLAAGGKSGLVFQNSLLAGLYAMSAVFIFMIAGANLIKNQK